MAPIEKNMFNLHTAIWIIGLFVVAVFVVLLFQSEANFVCGQDENKFSCGFTKELEYEKKEMVGYFYTLDDKENTVCVSEKLKLKFYENRSTVEARSGGKVHDKDGQLISRGWIQSGFRHGNNLSLAYITDSNSPTGAGVYYLMENGSEYAGYWLGLDFPLGHKVQCPYLLTEKEKPEHQTCEARWPDVFTGTPCTILKRR